MHWNQLNVVMVNLRSMVDSLSMGTLEFQDQMNSGSLELVPPAHFVCVWKRERKRDKIRNELLNFSSEKTNVGIFKIITLKLSLSAMEISTCGVKKCMGGVPFSADRNES